ncbi:MAG: PfkB family carbohydrate kinase [Promethearchaeota archaeon]
MNGKVVTFGEIMLRLSPPGFKRFAQAQSFNAVYGGAEANVAVSLSNFGIPVIYVTRLPNNDLGDTCVQFLRQYGVNTDRIIRGGDRLGIYFLEIGATARPSKIIYDRANSAIATAEVGMFEWENIFEGANWFHFTGITPSISQNLADLCLEAVKLAKDKDIIVSCDLNYRSKLWRYGKNPIDVMPEFIRYCDIVVGNEEDADKVLGIKAINTDITSGKIDPKKFKLVVEEIINQYPNLKYVAITLRGSISASHNTWSGVLYDGKQMYIGPKYDIPHIVDRVGAGDSFVAGIIYGFLTYKKDLKTILDFALAASCLKHTIIGDCNLIEVDEVLKLMGGDTSGRVSR